MRQGKVVLYNTSTVDTSGSSGVKVGLVVSTRPSLPSIGTNSTGVGGRALCLDCTRTQAKNTKQKTQSSALNSTGSGHASFNYCIHVL